MAQSIDFKTGSRTAMISVGTHSLFLSVHGPARTPGSPIVIILPGVTCSMNHWIVVQRLLSPTTCTLLYERSGMGASEEAPYPPTAVNIASELDVLLKAAQIHPPYVIVCHSYGGITSREFIHLRQAQGGKDDVVGIVFVDANQEKSYRIWPNPEFAGMTDGLNYLDATGLSRDHVMTNEEWKAVVDHEATEKYARTARKEMEYYVESIKALGVRGQLEMEPPLLGNHPVSVLKGNAARDSERMYEAAIRAGMGTPEERELFARKLEWEPPMDEAFQREILRLSTKGRFVAVSGSGHSVHFTEPEAVVEEVKWVLENLVN